MNPDAGLVVQSLGTALKHGEGHLSNVPLLMKRLLREGLWREFVTPMGERVVYDRIEPFVVTPPTKGLGATVDLVTRILKSDVEALDLWDQALQRSPGGDQRSERATIPNIVKDDAPVGNTQAAALRKLRRDAPELHEQVIAGRLSAHAAMVEAGFRPRTLTLRLDDPKKAAAAIKRHLTLDQLIELVEHLTTEDA
jgi:hypothetical protein